METALEAAQIEKYSTYRNSGVEWIGPIPSEWNVIKLKYISNIFNGDSIKDDKKSDFESSNQIDLPYISTKDIDLAFSIIEYENGLRIPNNGKFKIAPKNSFLLCIEGGSAGKKIGFLEQNVCFVNKLACFTTDNETHPKFLYYFAKSSAFQDQFQLSMTGLIGGVAISLIKGFETPFPGLSEQTNIANFLDRKIEELDRAIKQKDKLIELLKEHRQILIHQAVSRGLNPNVRMKDSGVEWLGEIPEHWRIVRNYSLFEESKETGDSSLQILSVSIHTAVSSEELSDEDNIRGKIRIKDRTSYKLVNINDIVFNMMRAWQGAIGAVGIKGMVSPAYIVARPKGAINSEFFEYQYRTDSFIQQMDRFSKGITDFRKRLYWDEFKQLITILPPIEEQTEILQFIKSASEKISTAISFKEREIEKLKEYKAILINSAVTGKIRVS